MKQRQARKRYEKIHLQRARMGFPRVSPAVLHSDGTVEALSAVPRSLATVSGLSGGVAVVKRPTVESVLQERAEKAANAVSATMWLRRILARLTIKFGRRGAKP